MAMTCPLRSTGTKNSSEINERFIAPGVRTWQLIRFRHFTSGSLALASLNHTYRNVLSAAQLYLGQRISRTSRLISIVALTAGLALALLLLHPATWAWAFQYYRSRSLYSG